MPRAAVAGHLEVEVVVAGQSRFRAARPVRLIELRNRIGRRCLVEHLAHVAGAGRDVIVCQQDRIGLHRELVGRIGGRVDADERCGVDRGRAAATGEVQPVRAVEHDGLGLVGDPADPAGAWRHEGPGAVLPGGDLARVTNPSARCAAGDEIGRALGGRAGRRSKIAIGNRHLDDGVEHAQQLVVRHVLLSLRGKQIGQAKIGRGVHDRWLRQSDGCRRAYGAAGKRG